jgi:hypothetical protein
VRTAIAAGLAQSPLVDMAAHTQSGGRIPRGAGRTPRLSLAPDRRAIPALRPCKPAFPWAMRVVPECWPTQCLSIPASRCLTESERWCCGRGRTRR